MLRVGLTGGLGSGKSTVAAMLAEHGAYVLSADELGRQLMEPGQTVYRAIAEHFGAGVVLADGKLDRKELGRLAFEEGRVEELNAIVHPATIALQQERAAAIFERDAEAVVVVESALIFETRFGVGLRERFDRMVLVTAPEWLKVERFVARAGGENRGALEAEARRRLAQMVPDEEKVGACDFVIVNGGTRDELHMRVAELWKVLQCDR